MLPTIGTGSEIGRRATKMHARGAIQRVGAQPNQACCCQRGGVLGVGVSIQWRAAAEAGSIGGSSKVSQRLRNALR